MKREHLYRLCLLWLMINGFSACGYNAQDDNYLPDDVAENHRLRAEEYMKLHRYSEAFELLKKALKLDRHYAEAHSAIAVLYERYFGDDEKAKQHYQQAIALKPNDSYINNNYGQLLCKYGQQEEAERHFLKAVENPRYRSPEVPYTNAALCILRSNDTYRSKNFAKAETYLRQALQKEPKFKKALYQMASLSYEQKRYIQAHRYLQRYLEEVAEHIPQTLWLGIRIERALNNRDAEASYSLLLRKKFPDAVETQKLNQSERP